MANSESTWARLALARALALGLALLVSTAGCWDDDDEELLVDIHAQMTPERRVVFTAEFAEATARFDYRQLDPAEVVEGRKLVNARFGGKAFQRFIVDGREDSDHVVYRTKGTRGRHHRIPSYFDPADRFMVKRTIFKINNRWEIVDEYWILFPADPGKRESLKGLIKGSEVAGLEDMMGNTTAVRGVMLKLPGFKTPILPARGPLKPRTPPRPATAGKQAAGQAEAGTARQSWRGMSGTPRPGPAKKSGLSVVSRSKMPTRKVKDVNGHEVTIYGQSGSASKTPGHDATMEAEAQRLARTGDYEYITLQRSWRTATGRVSKDRRIPDIIGVRRDGKVDAFEIKSKTDSQATLRSRLRKGMNTLPRERRGDYDVIWPRTRGGV